MFPNSTRILILDDMPTIRDLVRSQLNELGFTDITEAADGKEGYQALRDAVASGSPIQLVISDWNMPEMDGLELLKVVRATPEWGKLPFILLTSESEKEQVTNAVMAGVNQYIVKPFSQAMIKDKLEAVWNKVKDDFK